MSGGVEGAITAREQEVLNLLNEGLANKEIADSLGCSVRTVEFHISNLLRKTGASSRLELVASRRESIPAPPPSAEAPLIEIRMFSGAAAAVLGDTVISMWSAAATAERWAWKRALLDERIGQLRGSVLCLSLILETSTPPDASVRDQMKADFHRWGPSLRRFVGVPLGDSLWRAVVRMIGRTVLFISGTPQQMVATSVDHGLRLLLDAASPDTPPRRKLEQAVAELSRVLDATSPSSVSKNAS